MINVGHWGGKPLPDGWLAQIAVEPARRGRYQVFAHVTTPDGVTSDSLETDAGALMPVSPLALFPPVVIGLVDQVLAAAGLAAARGASRET